MNKVALITGVTGQDIVTNLPTKRRILSYNRELLPAYQDRRYYAGCGL